MIDGLIDTLREKDVTVSFGGADINLDGAVDTLDQSLVDAVRCQKPLLMSQLASPVYISVQPLNICADGVSPFILVAWFDNRVVIWSPYVHGDKLEEVVQTSPFFHGDPITQTVCAACPSIPSVFEQMAALGRRFCSHDVRQTVRLTNGAVPPEAQWIDTADLARAAGYPGDLRKLVVSAPSFFHQTVIKQFGDKSRNSGHRSLHGQLVDGAALSIAAQNLFDSFHDFFDPVAAWAHHRINNRGVCVDLQLAENLRVFWEQSRSQLMKPIQDGTAGISPADFRNDTKCSAWLLAHGLAVTRFNRGELSRLLDAVETGKMQTHPAALYVLRAKLFLLRPLGSQLQTMVDTCDCDGRLRHQFVFHGGHTGRFASDGAQLHNFQRADPKIEDHESLIAASYEPTAFEQILSADVGPDDAVASLRRFCLIAKQENYLCIADYRSIEPRVLAWCAGELNLLEAFRAGQDPYLEMAECIFGRPLSTDNHLERQIGKVTILGAGYGMGSEAFDEFATKWNVDLESAGLCAEQVITAFRSRFPRICGGLSSTGLWQQVELAAMNGIRSGHTTFAGRCEFHYDGHTLFVKLPSGRWICYRNAAMVQEGGDLQGQLVFSHPKKGRETTWGGKLTENIVQGIARDLLVRAMVRCEQVGLPVVMHVHDEIVVEVAEESADEACALLREVMTSPPDWAPRLPIDISVKVGSRYGM